MMYMNKQKTDCIIIGGGPAGMMAAVTAADHGKNVLLFEHNKFCGKKLRITGKGRCNVCNNCDIKTFLANVPQNPKFLYSALNRFSPTDAISFFEQIGVPLKTERGNRVFPVSDNAHDIANALERRMKQLGVFVRNENVTDILIDHGAVLGVTTEKADYYSSSVLIATGGISYPLTGSTGDGYHFAEKAGHFITPLRPSLVPLESEDDYCADMQGFSLKNVTLSVLNNRNELVYKELGEMMFTHFGVTGPLVLSASSHMRDFENNKYRLEVDLKPGLDEKKLDERILRDFEKYKNKNFGNSLSDLAGKTMIPILVRLSGIPEDEKVNSITKEQRQKLVNLFKAFPVSVSGTRPASEAIVTSGGISVTEIDPRTMQSKLCQGLFFAGEILDIDAYTGGFNLQIAWSTGFVAGMNL